MKTSTKREKIGMNLIWPNMNPSMEKLRNKTEMEKIRELETLTDLRKNKSTK